MPFLARDDNVTSLKSPTSLLTRQKIKTKNGPLFEKPILKTEMSYKIF